jgi:hypothetical protein
MGTIEIIKMLAPMVPFGVLVFQAGMQAERLDDLFTKTQMLESEQKSSRDLLYDIHGKVCTVEQDVKNIQRLVDHQRRD